MPRQAITTGCVDFILPAAEIGKQTAVPNRAFLGVEQRGEMIVPKVLESVERRF